jgi:hypothetical protein
MPREIVWKQAIAIDQSPKPDRGSCSVEDHLRAKRSGTYADYPTIIRCFPAVEESGLMSRYSEYDGHPRERRVLPAAFVGHWNHQRKATWPCLPDAQGNSYLEYGRPQKRPGFDALDIPTVGASFRNPHDEKQTCGQSRGFARPLKEQAAQNADQVISAISKEGVEVANRARCRRNGPGPTGR